MNQPSSEEGHFAIEEGHFAIGLKLFEDAWFVVNLLVQLVSSLLCICYMLDGN